MNRDKEIDEAILEIHHNFDTTKYDNDREIVLEKMRQSARWADSTSPYKKALERAVEALKKYEKTFVTIRAQIELRPEMFKVWEKQMETLLGDAPIALAEIQKLLEGKDGG